MIISYKYKFLFIGLPFSASSAITKELHKEYEGEPYLRKHSLYHEFKRVATKEEKKFFVFSVLRNPMEIAVTMYEKMKANAKGNFTNPNLFTENGGHISKKQRERFNFIHEKNASFQEYFIKFYNKPFDNFASITLDKCDYIIRYENITEDYKIALKKSGIKNPKDLPVENKTDGKKKDLSEYYTKDIQSLALFVFGPFLKKYDYGFPEHWTHTEIPLSARFLFYIGGIIRKWKWKLKKNSIRKSIKGSIYGDIQRKSN
ncbi:MAG: hypothetical protein P8H17_00295 [Flavobacteriales bacterium]|nr:hypothetical protein [Flavobacteriales bacterium]